MNIRKKEKRKNEKEKHKLYKEERKVKIEGN